MKKIIHLLVCMAMPFALLAQQETEPMKNVALVIHGGAGTLLREHMTDSMENAFREKLTEALKTGYDVLQKGGSSLDAVEQTIHVMEESPLFNAGKGAVFTNAGTNELDASIMDGKTGMAGAVAGVRRIKSPISAARKVMEASPHVMMTGSGAETFAKQQGLDMVDTNYFYTEKRYRQLLRMKEEEANQQKDGDKGMAPLDVEFDEKWSGNPEDNGDRKFGTVGCVALDVNGNLAAGTSTGGMTNKRFGRVGDSPIIGAGTYANNATCGVSSTGHGEYFIRNVVAYDIAALMDYKDMTLQQAAEEVILKKLPAIGGTGGVVALDAKGNVAMTFNTPGMYRGYITRDGQVVVKIFSGE
ncbi:MAG: isoaspartyl peptidase/L-asparaginase [Flavobacteriales bacterium]|nr:isoaspartyl peptidase/L-asparaginase [Flavobacteriales bacterium]MCB9449108.1 isoaspartyl peptidase/L-asparaginase [Flavobacteriales bacterium]